VTDGQTELPWHIRTIAYMLSRVKTCEQSTARLTCIVIKVQVTSQK